MRETKLKLTSVKVYKPLYHKFKVRAMDDEFTLELSFEVPMNISNFILSDEDIALTNGVYGRACFCPGGQTIISSGCIKGVEINDNEWQIDINVNFTDLGESRELMLEGVFNNL